MGFCMTQPRQEYRDPPSKNRVVGSRSLVANRVRQNRPQTPVTASETSVTFTKTVSGISCWPSRDPIGEQAFYGEVVKRIVSRIMAEGEKQGLTGWELKRYVYLRMRRVTQHLTESANAHSYLFVQNAPIINIDPFGDAMLLPPIRDIITGAIGMRACLCIPCGTALVLQLSICETVNMGDDVGFARCVCDVVGTGGVTVVACRVCTIFFSIRDQIRDFVGCDALEASP